MRNGISSLTCPFFPFFSLFHTKHTKYSVPTCQHFTFPVLEISFAFVLHGRIHRATETKKLESKQQQRKTQEMRGVINIEQTGTHLLQRTASRSCTTAPQKVVEQTDGTKICFIERWRRKASISIILYMNPPMQKKFVTNLKNWASRMNQI